MVVRNPSCGGGGGGGEYPIVLFQITEADCANRVATATVVGFSCNSSVAVLGDTIELCDTLGCFLIGPDQDQTNRYGYAHQMTVSGSLTCSGIYDGDTCPWTILGLCPLDFNCV